MFHEHDKDERERQLDAVIRYMTRAYCAAMDVEESVITVHAHEDGTAHDRMLTLHIATGPDSCTRLAVLATVSDLASKMFAESGGPR
jgi:hypothetical protein